MRSSEEENENFLTTLLVEIFELKSTSLAPVLECTVKELKPANQGHVYVTMATGRITNLVLQGLQ